MKRTMTEYQRELVVEHLDLIDWVIRRRIQVRGMILLSYEDYYSVGCEALCHAAMHYRPENGEFAPFACTVLHLPPSITANSSCVISSFPNF